MPIIERYLSEEFLQTFLVDFKNLIKIVNHSFGELDLAIRNNYLNLYYKGNSLAKISPKVSNKYEIIIHEKFFENTYADSVEFYEDRKVVGNYIHVILSPQKSPLRFLQKKHINQFCSRVNKVNYGEEIVFEQALITDNMDREDIILIDRQVTDRRLKGRRLDLLGLKQIQDNVYKFLVIEVKLGKNSELKEKVAHQLNGYVAHIQKNIQDYQHCYQKQFEQKKRLGLINAVQHKSIKIEKQVEGLVVVGGYSKIAEESITKLEHDYPGISVKKFIYKL